MTTIRTAIGTTTIGSPDTNTDRSCYATVRFQLAEAVAKRSFVRNFFIFG